MSSAEFSNVTVTAKANIYFEGKVVSHTLRFADGSKKTIGLVYPGRYHFSTDAAERMEIIAGACKVKLDGPTGQASSSEGAGGASGGASQGPGAAAAGSTSYAGLTSYAAGSSFDVPAKSGFGIVVEAGITEYICSFL